MTPDSSDVAKYDFTADDELFVDTNVWLLIHGPQKPCDRRVAIYSLAFRHILEAGSRIYIDILLVSEFINAYAKMKWKINTEKMNFKAFRNSPEFKPIAREAADDIKRVLDCCSSIESGFETLDVNALIGKYAKGGADFNDLVIRDLCKSRGLKLITDDGDFDGQGISVLTANKHLLG